MTIPPDLDRRIRADLATREDQNLSSRAFFTKNAQRRVPEAEGWRNAFCRDADRIMHSFAFTRYFDKTQVFFWIKSDIHSHRMLHVQLVSKLARFVAHILRLNEDLVEAIALGHDIGHCPFGHDGEMVLRELCEKAGIGQLWHNYESVWFLQEIEMQNLTLPVLDGILCHNGESHFRLSAPIKQTLSWENLEGDMTRLQSGLEKDPKPKTLEACLVRFVDIISYISRDVLDAENLGLLRFIDIPDSVTTHLGRSNRDIINNLITDLIVNSYDQDYIAYSPPTYSALQDLYQFNFSHIYSIPQKSDRMPVINQAFRLLWDHYYADLTKPNLQSRIFTDHLLLNLKNVRLKYPNIQTLAEFPYSHQDPRIIVRDYIAGMTDQYFWQVVKELDPSLGFSYDIVY